MKAMHTHKSALAYPPGRPEYACVFPQRSYIVHKIYAYLSDIMDCILDRIAVEGVYPPLKAYFSWAWRALRSSPALKSPFICLRSLTYWGRSLFNVRSTVSLSP